MDITKNINDVLAKKAKNKGSKFEKNKENNKGSKFEKNKENNKENSNVEQEHEENTNQQLKKPKYGVETGDPPVVVVVQGGRGVSVIILISFKYLFFLYKIHYKISPEKLHL